VKLRQEQIVFLAALLLLGFLSYRLFSQREGRRATTQHGEQLELLRYPVPDVAAALPQDPAHKPLGRNLLAPPSDTRPLPPLPIVEPPRKPLAALFPPPEPGPAPAAFGALLRRELHLAIDPEAAAELFAEASTAGDVEYGFDDFELFKDPGAKQKTSLADQLDAAQGGAADDPFKDLTAPELQQLLAGYKVQYDWFFDEVRHTFGRIQNKDRYGLKADPKRAQEPLLFVEILPERGGVERFPGLEPVSIPRDRAKEWGFADTFANTIEVKRLELGGAIARSTYPAALAFADECVRGRLEAPRALPIAEEIYELCARFDPADPAPRLGLARCYEVGFKFEQAFQTYGELVKQFAAHADVHARLGLLEARFCLFEQAEQRLREAVRIDRSSWEARAALGRFLVERGRPAEALEHLDAADKAIPNDPSTLKDRVAIRVDLASARLALGEVGEAHTLFSRALATDPDNQRARAGYIATELLAPAGGVNGAAEPPQASGAAEPGLELLLARGLAALASGELATAKAQLEAAAEADPLRAHLAWRALSFLAEVAGQHGEAQRYVEQALECAPSDPWSLYQAGRLRAEDEDVAGARTAFLGALEQDLDFVDALAALGEMAFKMGDFDDAERYLERAVAIEPERADLFGLRGLNHLLRASTPEAREAFEAGRALRPDDEVCRAGLAWCTYLSGDSAQALVALRELDDSLRERPPTDPMRTWATAQMERIQDHEEKVEWSDGFDRKGEIRNDWTAREGAGPTFRIADDQVVLEGTFTKAGMAMLYRERAASLFVSAEADVWVDPSTKADVGLFIAKELSRARTGPEIVERVAVVRHHDGSLQVNLQKEGNTPKLVDMEEPFPTGRWVRLRIERAGDETDARVTVYADGVPLIENAPMAALSSSTQLIFGFFSEGEPGRTVQAKLDDFRVVYREKH
jgi:tetratricopeptide (TPR) repeat protein